MTTPRGPRVEDVYKPPVAAGSVLQVAVPQVAVSAARPFYVVSIPKLLVLFFATFGLYQFYWFHRHWSRYRPFIGQQISPFWRTLFSVVFAPKLFSSFHAYALLAGKPSTGRLSGMATIYVALTVVGALFDQLIAEQVPMGGFMVMALGLSTVFPLAVAQRNANRVCDDPDGQSNARFTFASGVVIALGAAVWALVLFSLFTLVMTPTLR